MEDKEYLARMREALADWEKRHSGEFEKERKREFVSEGGLLSGRLYTPADLARKGFDYWKDLGLPGEYPFTRGITATGGRSQPALLMTYSGYGTPEKSNALWKALVAAGTQSVMIAYDLPSQLGLDPDNPRAAGEVGRVGTSMSSQEDWEIAWDGIDLSKVMVSEVYNAPAIFGIANHLILAEKQGIPLSEVRGNCQNDILKEYYARGNYIFPPAQSMRLVVDILSYCARNVPKYLPMQVCTVHQYNMGATPVHEMAFALADCFTYFQAAVDRGIDIDLIAPGVIFLTAIGAFDFLEQIAKHRAARRIYARVTRERFKAKRVESQTIKFYASTGGPMFYREEYLNNIARGAIGALGAVLAGVQYFFMTGYDEQYGIPTRDALLTSTQTSRVAAYETGCNDVVDPLGGSYYVESLTSELEERICQELDKIEKRGGVIKCLEDGYLHRAIAQDAYRWHRRYENGEIIRVGVNAYKAGAATDRPTVIYRSDPDEEQKRKSAILELRKKRDNARVSRALKEIKAVAKLEAAPGNNLFPPVLEAARCYATVGEVCDVLREVWGEYREPAIF